MLSFGRTTRQNGVIFSIGAPGFPLVESCLGDDSKKYPCRQWTSRFGPVLFGKPISELPDRHGFPFRDGSKVFRNSIGEEIRSLTPAGMPMNGFSVTTT